MKTWDIDDKVDAAYKMRMEQVNHTIRTGGPATGGLTVLDYFAAKAMQSLIEKMDETPFDVADEAYDFAIAMLERRSGKLDK